MARYGLRKSIRCGCFENLRPVGYVYLAGPFDTLNEAFQAAQSKNDGYEKVDRCGCRCEVFEVEQ